MQVRINNEYNASNNEIYLLAGDIGGTNTNLALMAYNEESFTKILETITPTDKIINFLDPLSATLEEIKKNFPQVTLKSCCISAAGPIQDNFCQLTNASWFVDGPLIQKTTGIKTLVINDFIALSYGIPLLDLTDSNSIAQFPNLRGELPKPLGKNKAVIGAGTGLGVGYIPWINKKYRACPSEGGHFDFPAFDDETTELMLFLRNKLGFHPGTERLLSGRGLIWIFDWYLSKGFYTTDAVIQSILTADETDKPYFISKNVESHELCSSVHRLFRKIYGKMAGNYATLFIPQGGLYIAGGVISKDERHFLADDTFMKAFSINHKENISQLLETVPVYIVRDYSTSLLGAAVAALNF